MRLTPIQDLILRWQGEAKNWQARADSAGAVRSFAAAYEYMTRAEQYASCAVQLEIALAAMCAGEKEGAAVHSQSGPPKLPKPEAVPMPQTPLPHPL